MCSGHAPTHVRQCFIEAVEAYHAWLSAGGTGEPPTVKEACSLVWHCTDQLPYDVFTMLLDCGLTMRGRSYAAGAQAMADSLTW